ncbi:MAG TPA: hypothetical protein VKR31_10110 [Rhizomicrobium sp.]|nr:hypothetical protein [Rhizomicrobium sp.]
MKTETILVIGAVVVVLLLSQVSSGSTVPTGSPMVPGNRFRAPDTMPRYDIGRYGAHYGNAPSGDGPNGGVGMWSQRDVYMPQTVPTYPSLNGPAIGSDGQPITPSGYGSTDFGARPPGWPYFEHWPNPLMKIQQTMAVRAGIRSVLHPPGAGGTQLGSAANGWGAGGGVEREGTGLGHIFVHV